MTKSIPSVCLIGTFRRVLSGNDLLLRITGVVLISL